MNIPLRELKDFFLHLRLNYQIFILSGPFLLGGLLSPQTDLRMFVIQFIAVQILLFGGVTAYNSYWDKDEGPIGGLRNPPKMKPWMLYASWLLQLIGLMLASFAGLKFIVFYLFSILLFWLYSSPHARWKGRPILSLVAIGVATVFSTVFLGFWAFGGQTENLPLLAASVGSMFLVLSMYPMSQMYQTEADKIRGDTTFAVQYGTKGVRSTFKILYPIGIALLAAAFYFLGYFATIATLILGTSAGIYAWFIIKKLSANPDEYDKIMRVKYVSGMIFSLGMILFFVVY